MLIAVHYGLRNTASFLLMVAQVAQSVRHVESASKAAVAYSDVADVTSRDAQAWNLSSRCRGGKWQAIVTILPLICSHQVIWCEHQIWYEHPDWCTHQGIGREVTGWNDGRVREAELGCTSDELRQLL